MIINYTFYQKFPMLTIVRIPMGDSKNCCSSTRHWGNKGVCFSIVMAEML